MATFGVPDFLPSPRSSGECVAFMVYIVTGVVILAVLMVAISYHLQRFFFMTVRGALLDSYRRYRVRKSKSNAQP